MPAQISQEVLGDEFTKLPPDENEGRWGISQQALQMLKGKMSKMFTVTHGTEVEVNGVIAEMLKLHAELKPGDWRLNASKQVMNWALAPDIVIAIEYELETYPFCKLVLGWLRRRSSRPYLAHYSPLYRTRELPGFLLNVVFPFARKFRYDPVGSLQRLKI